MSNNVWFSKCWIFFLFIKSYILYPPFLWLCFFYTSVFSNLTTHWDHQWGCKNYWFLSLTPAILKILFNWHIGQSSPEKQSQKCVCVCVDLLWGIGLHDYGNWKSHDLPSASWTTSRVIPVWAGRLGNQRSQGCKSPSKGRRGLRSQLKTADQKGRNSLFPCPSTLGRVIYWVHLFKC